MECRKIGILGGTFDPIHNAHLLLGEAAREQFGLDRIIFIPNNLAHLINRKEVTKLEEEICMKDKRIADAEQLIKDLLGSENSCCEEEMFFEIRHKAENFLKE